MDIDIRAVGEDRIDDYIRAVRRAFGDDPAEGEEKRVLQLSSGNRTKAAFDGDRIVGTFGAFSLSLAVPGETGVATAGLTRVTVSPSHRRRGLLRAMMQAHVAEVAEHGEALSALWASETAIYGRFGYGLSTDMLQASYDNRQAGIRAPERPDAIVMADPAEAESVMPDLYEQVWRRHPGRFARDEPWWRIRILPDYEWMQHGTGPRRHVIAYRDGRPTGYATYRQKKIWNDLDLPEGEIHVGEVVAVDAGAEHTLWSALSTIDLFPKVVVATLPVDSMLPWLATNIRAIDRRVTDGLQVRVFDVAAALEARRFDRPGSLRIAVEDEFVPAAGGTFQLDIDDEGTATCRRTDAEPDLRLTAFALSTLYLGARRVGPLVHGGEITGSPEAVAALDRCFAWPVTGWCGEMF